MVAAAVYGCGPPPETPAKRPPDREAAICDVTTAAKTLASAQGALAAAGDKTAGSSEAQIETAVLHGEIDQTDVRLGELGSALADSLRPERRRRRKGVSEQGTDLSSE